MRAGWGHGLWVHETRCGLHAELYGARDDAHGAHATSAPKRGRPHAARPHLGLPRLNSNQFWPAAKANISTVGVSAIAAATY